jgi:hypothetical protein
MSSDAAKAMWPGLARDDGVQPQKLRHDKASVSAADAMYPHKKEQPAVQRRIKVPMTPENLDRVSVLRRKV